MSIGAWELGVIVLLLVSGLFLLGSVFAGGFLAYRLSRRRPAPEAGGSRPPA
ncbi:MAG: hypothetical protein WBQ50_09880 [Nocardioides sp.]